MKKKLLKIIIFLGLTVVNLAGVKAASGSLSVTSVSSAIVGNNVSVTVKATSSNIFYWQFYVTYDTSRLKLISGSTTIQGEAGGEGSIEVVNNVTKTFKFEAIKTGTAFVTVTSGSAGMNINTNGETISYTTATKNIKISLPTPKSTNNNLSALLIEGVTITPEFNKNTLEYSATLEPNTISANIKTALEDNKATITGGGEVQLIEGLNTISLVVTAENGSTKTYTLLLTVKELDPINIKVDGKEYKLIRKADQLDTFSTFVPKVITYEGNDIPALYNSIVKYTIVGAKDEAGNKYYFRYDAKAKTFIKYQELNMDGIIFYPLTTNKKPDNKMYKPATVVINNIKINGYKVAKNSEFALVYGINVENNQEGFYLYDTIAKTMQRYNGEEFTLLHNDIKYYMIITIAFGIGMLLCFAIIFSTLYTKAKHKKNKELKKEPEVVNKEAEVVSKEANGKKKKDKEKDKPKEPTILD